MMAGECDTLTSMIRMSECQSYYRRDSLRDHAFKWRREREMSELAKYGPKSSLVVCL